MATTQQILNALKTEFIGRDSKTKVRDSEENLEIRFKVNPSIDLLIILILSYYPYLLIILLSLIWRAKRMFGTIANGPLPGRKYICSPLKSEVIILGFR